MQDYRCWLAEQKGLQFADYDALWSWSVTQLEDFWASIWEYFDVRSRTPYSQVLDAHIMPGAKWFDGATLNLTEQLFRFNTAAADADKPAIISRSESRPEMTLSWRELQQQIASVAQALRGMSVVPGDRIAAYLPNVAETVVAFYACASIGAIWSSCSPDMGPASVLDRFRQIEPKVLIAADGYRYGGKDFDRLAVVETMRAELNSLTHTVLLPYLDAHATLPGALPWHSLLQDLAATMPFTALPFDHPLWILYSSGTTGMPKPIVHGQGGTLLESLKGHALHLDLGPRDRFLWFSTTGWVMWNSQVTGLLVGATICIYDGNPGYPDLGTLWQFAAETDITFFGAGAAYFGNCMKADITPSATFDLRHLTSVGSTGSPLSIDAHAWIFDQVGSDIFLASISGGTDIVAAFVGACPILPLYAGEMQCRCLGIAVHAFDDAGRPLVNAVGELVVTEPMPTMPLYFWNDAQGKRYRESYFDTYPGVWRHGDWIRFTEHGGAVIYGRSDTTINRHGIRMGTSEIYRVVEDFPQVLDSLVVDLEYLGRPSFMPLFVVLREGVMLDEALMQQMRDAIRTALSARHVPDAIFAVPGVPRTLTGKKMELPVKRLLLGMAIEKIGNRDAMSNPESLAYFVEFAARQVHAWSGSGFGGSAARVRHKAAHQVLRDL
jgi:acetoacetyl-CoA synthetase